MIQAPSLRYWVHLVAPGWNVIGGGEPVLPGVSIGHNEHGAWGLTIFGQDSEDLYVYDTNPANANEYRYRGGWEAMRVITESIADQRREARNRRVEIHASRSRVVRGHANHKAYALRAAWMELGGAPYLASLRMDQAKTWEEFREACAFNHMPSENMVWVDRHGTIGWQAAGVQPMRRNWSGLLPVPGDGRYEWDGFLPITALPSESESGARLHRHREQLPLAQRLSVPRSAALPVERPVPRLAHLGSARLRTTVHRRRDGAAAERRPLDHRPLDRAAAARSQTRAGIGQGARHADHVGLRPRQGLCARRRLRDVVSTSARQHERRGGAGGAAHGHGRQLRSRPDG